MMHGRCSLKQVDDANSMSDICYPLRPKAAALANQHPVQLLVVQRPGGAVCVTVWHCINGHVDCWTLYDRHGWSWSVIAFLQTSARSPISAACRPHRAVVWHRDFWSSGLRALESYWSTIVSGCRISKFGRDCEG